MADWSIAEAISTYGIDRWGHGFFSVNDEGHLEIQVQGNRLDLKRLMDDLGKRGLHPPVLLRFSDILACRMKRLYQAFDEARQDAEYKGRYYGVYPIKVNQQFQVIEEIVEFGSEFHWGLEAGSKPELHAVLAMLEDVEGLIVCNGYKDAEFIHLALHGLKMGKKVFIVIEKPGELELVLEAAKQLNVRPMIGLRCRLATLRSGRWLESSGDASKFGLSADEILSSVKKLERAGLLDCLRMLHFHLGSQIPKIVYVKQAMQEAGRFYAELRFMGAPIEFIDVGGGLGVDYEGGLASVDYSLGEYASDIVWQMKSICSETGLPEPHIISESGRALVAHHAVLVFNVLEVSRRLNQAGIQPPPKKSLSQLRELFETLSDIQEGRLREAFHDAQSLREDIMRLFALGHCSLNERAYAETLYWHIMNRLRHACIDDPALQEDLAPYIPLMADRYFCNLSVFQSLPDTWAIGQVFPVAPIHRLNEKPTRAGVLVDITCDSDGKIAFFPAQEGLRPTLPLHEFTKGEPYLLGVFLIGAYQEILGDLHNLFGDTHAVHVRIGPDGYELEQVVEGETVAEVLDYVQFHERVLLDRMRRQVQAARNLGLLKPRDANRFLRFYKEGLAGYTYLEEHLPQP